MNHTPNIQQVLFQMIRNKIPTYLSFAEEISQLLNISTDSTYRRIRGEKPISLDEIHLLCRHFDISLDNLLSIKSDSIVFYGKNVDHVELSFETYLKSLLQDLRNINSYPVKEVFYSAKDIPIVYNFMFPEFAWFKFYFWMRSILQYQDYADKRLSFDNLDDSLIKLSKNIFEIYTEIPSTEIWNLETINSVIRQIEFCRDSGLFAKKEDVNILYDQLGFIIDHIERQAEAGTKFHYQGKPGKKENFHFYHNEVVLGDNSILVNTGENKISYITHSVLNYIITSDKKFCDYMHHSIVNIIKKSNLLSSVNAKDRSMFFNSLKDKIAAQRYRDSLMVT